MPEKGKCNSQWQEATPIADRKCRFAVIIPSSLGLSGNDSVDANLVAGLGRPNL
jgi:hypothetical protein